MIIVLLRNIMGKKCVHSLLIGLLVMLPFGLGHRAANGRTRL